MINDVIGDSGAWSFAQGKSDITVEELIAVLKSCGKQFTRYFNFDTDFRDKGFENNIANQILMEKAGLSPVPVVHNFFDKEIEYYVKSGKYDWLALGSSQSTNFDDIRYGDEANHIGAGLLIPQIHGKRGWFLSICRLC
jgi:hypothetical protein